MPYTREQYIEAGKKAVAAGDIEAANEIASHIDALEPAIAPATPTTTTPVEAISPPGMFESAARGAANFALSLPKAATQFSEVMSSPYTGLKPGTLQNQIQKNPLGNAVMTAGDPSIQDRAAQEQHGIMYGLGNVAPALALPSVSARVGAPLLEKMAAGAASGLIGSQATTYDSPEDRAKGAYDATVLGGLLPASLVAAGKLLSPLKKYIPIGTKSAATEEIFKKGRSGASLESEKALYKSTEDLYGPDIAEKMALYDHAVDDPQIKNLALAYGRAVEGEGAASVKQAAVAKQAAITKELKDFANTTRLSPEETTALNSMQGELLPNLGLDSKDVAKMQELPLVNKLLRTLDGQSLPEHKAVKSALEDVRSSAAEVRDINNEIAMLRSAKKTSSAKTDYSKQIAKLTEDKLAATQSLQGARDALAEARDAVTRALPEEAISFQSSVSGVRNDSGYYWDKVRRRLQQRRMDLINKGDNETAKDYQAAIKQIDNVMSKHTGGVSDNAGNYSGGKYDMMKTLQQREILTSNLDKSFKEASTTRINGQEVIDPKAVKAIFSGRSFNEMAEDIGRLKTPELRSKASRQLNLLKSIVTTVDDKSVLKQLGASNDARVPGGGIYTRGLNEVGTFMRGGFNKEVAYLIDHPKEYLSQLEAIAANKNKQSRIAELSLLLGTIQGNQTKTQGE